tara:strand:+ start:549 stop:755 length:207 start_codon:yes stop_codon:yes gene_type:complete
MKFKVGDLVTLSAAGKRTIQNYEVRTGFGIVLFNKYRGEFPIKCAWFGGKKDEFVFKPYELKFFKKKT